MVGVCFGGHEGGVYVESKPAVSRRGREQPPHFFNFLTWSATGQSKAQLNNEEVTRQLDKEEQLQTTGKMNCGLEVIGSRVQGRAYFRKRLSEQI